MKTRLYLMILLLIPGLLAFSQDKKNVLSVSMAYGIEFENSIYMDFEDPDYEIWATPLTNFSFNLTYEYYVADYLKIGPRLEYEKINFESFYTDETYANRLAIGFQFLAEYPKTPLHAEMGGYVNYGRITCDEFDNAVSGIENGLIAGPAFRLDDFSVALLFQPCFGYYFIANGENPESGLLMYPKIVCKLSYSF